MAKAKQTVQKVAGARLMRQQVQMELGRLIVAQAELARAQTYNTDDGKSNEDGAHDVAVDTGIREGSAVDSLAGVDHFAVDGAFQILDQHTWRIACCMALFMC
ncbi:hypothetical protein E2562_012457 [Oryza meyeriana var. granulata]|uniref:Uncharacterized protein n=1 Tax=Oryza meyeriana var. granulata TaxID=110450 RepID=A0A6G1C5Y3_9ORYZ|nr:hypothetical protein E2562_012457 [Oryza meyeriana var. granulata]